MTATHDTLLDLTATVAERVDRREARSRHDLELAVLVLEDLADEHDGWAFGTTSERFGSPQEEPTVVLLRRLANVHFRLGVADRRGELAPTTEARVAALSRVLHGEALADQLELVTREPSLAFC